MPNKKIVSLVKEQLFDRRKKLVIELKKLYNEREDLESADEINSKIDIKISEIALIDSDLERKDKKSSNVVWADNDFTPRKKRSGKNATVVNQKDYDDFKDKKWVIDDGPQAMWLKPGILVKARGRLIPGIVINVRANFATVLFGDSEIDIRKLALRPAEWEN